MKAMVLAALLLLSVFSGCADSAAKQKTTAPSTAAPAKNSAAANEAGAIDENELAEIDGFAAEMEKEVLDFTAL